MSATATADTGFRSYEIYQRERVGETTSLIKPRQLTSPEFLADPYPLLEILREHYPCYRDWAGNAFWITRYDDVTSVFVDDANFETRPKRWWMGLDTPGRDLRNELPVLTSFATRLDSAAPQVAEDLVAALVGSDHPDLATGLAARYPIELLARVLDLPRADLAQFATLYWTMQRGVSWDPAAMRSGVAAAQALVDYFGSLVDARRAEPGDDLISAIATLELDGDVARDGEARGTAADVVVTLLEGDDETLHGALANMWFQLLRHPDQLARVAAERRLVRFAYQETLRHSPPVLAAQRFARHEVERFGRVLPEGAMLTCSAGAANRDPRVFTDPDDFVVGRKDLCQREPRGAYRADGLPSGIAFGLGQPSKFPAVPEDRPRSLYAITRDLAVVASQALLDAAPGIRPAPDSAPTLRSLRIGEMHTCWHLPVVLE